MTRYVKSYAVLVDASDVAPSTSVNGKTVYDYSSAHCFSFFGAKMYVRSVSVGDARRVEVTFICRDCGVHIERRINRGAFKPVMRCTACAKKRWRAIDAERAEKAGAGGHKIGRNYFKPDDNLLIELSGLYAGTLKPISQLRAKGLFVALDARFERVEPGTLWPRLLALCRAGRLKRVPVGLNASGGIVYSLVPNTDERLKQWNDALWAVSKPIHRKRFNLKNPIDLF